MNNLKAPFIISVLFHGIALFSIAIFYHPVRETFMEITPLEFIRLSEDASKDIQIQQHSKQIPKTANIAPPSPSPSSKREGKIEESAPVPIAKKILDAPSPSVEHSQEVNDKANPPIPDTEGLEGKTIQIQDDKVNAAPTSSAINLFEAMVRNKIEKAKFYPRWARERGYEGVVGVQFVIKPDGNVMGLKVVRPCHCEILNNAACKAIMKAAPFTPRPQEIGEVEMAMDINVGFRLE